MGYNFPPYILHKLLPTIELTAVYVIALHLEIILSKDRQPVLFD